MLQIEQLRKQIAEAKTKKKSSLLIDGDDEYQEQLEIRWHIDELEDQLNNLLEKNRAEEEIEGW